jgi:hypothetical protein
VKIKKPNNEQYTQALIAVGIPAIAWLFTDFKIALSVFIIIQIILGILRERE